MKPQTLAEALAGEATLPEAMIENRCSTEQLLLDITDPKALAMAVIGSREFKQYILNGLTLGSLPSAIVCRLMDYGWGKPPERVEHTGRDGSPIEMVTVVRRVVVRVEQQDAQCEQSASVH